MTLQRSLLMMVLAGVVATAPLSFADAVETPATAATVQKFGPYEALVFDKTMLSDVKVDEKGDIYLMLQPDKIDSQLTMKISMQKGAGYRKWFTGDETLVAQQNAKGGRTAGVWSDRIQTSATYIEYWAEGKCFLHLKKTDQ
jgi:hypothetical protein